MNTIIAEALAASDIIYWGKYVGSLGIPFPCWTDSRRVMANPKSMVAIGRELTRLVQEWSVDLVAGAATAGIPFATAVSLQAQLPMIYVAKEVKTYGNKSAIQGLFKRGQNVVLIDDASGNGSTKQAYCEQLLAEGLVLKHVVVLIGFGQTIIPWYREHGVEFHELVQFYELMDYLKETGRLSSQLHGFVRNMYQLEDFKRTWNEAYWQKFLAQVKKEGIDYVM